MRKHFIPAAGDRVRVVGSREIFLVLTVDTELAVAHVVRENTWPGREQHVESFPLALLIEPSTKEEDELGAA